MSPSEEPTPAERASNELKSRIKGLQHRRLLFQTYQEGLSLSFWAVPLFVEMSEVMWPLAEATQLITA